MQQWPGVAALRYARGAVAAGEYWRLLTCNFVHLGAWHWVLNVLSLVILTVLCPEKLPLRVWLLRLLVLGLAVGVGLHAWVPAVGSYVGLSGMIYGLFCLGLGRQAWRGEWIAIVALLIVVVRIGTELAGGVPASEARLISGRVVPESHLFGALAALGLGAYGWLRARGRYGSGV